jgi:hypothetical protein
LSSVFPPPHLFPFQHSKPPAAAARIRSVASSSRRKAASFWGFCHWWVALSPPFTRLSSIIVPGVTFFLPAAIIGFMHRYDQGFLSWFKSSSPPPGSLTLPRKSVSFLVLPEKRLFFWGFFACRGFLDFALLGFLPWYDRGFLPVRFEFINRNAALSLPPAARHCLPSSLSVPVLPKKGIYLGFSCATVSSAEIINDFSILFVRIEFFSLSLIWDFSPSISFWKFFPLFGHRIARAALGRRPIFLLFFSPLIYV